ncbi:hypothetical protein [Candidatus Odyssella acanthamoebae]|uniref:Autotransporter domain-containing protein n=1 Tax=Candidatus Odyssella acanthamoebae TaxID=91604 RepID=A0A077AWV6_9PROT|nr:hypothetical protein [Candidatus Paracaedibacter acanthamoebae]AIK96464.1 hypothetical protein ID47_06470 [Candidatus Paracaedibacter acanthamoebae]
MKIGNNLAGSIDNSILFSMDGIIDTNGYNAVLNGDLSGSGKLIKNGTGILELTRASSPSFAGAIINAGELKVNGVFSNSAVTVNNGAKLTGNGMVGSLTNLGTVKPGTSLGVIQVATDFDNTNGTYVCEINRAGGSDLIAVGGTAMLGGLCMLYLEPVIIVVGLLILF